MKELAPVVVFTYRRPDHLRNTLTSLMNCHGFEQSPVIIYCDGPQNDEEVSETNATRDLAKSMLGSRAEYHFSEVNLGLSQSIISGVNDVLHRYGRIIVVEDDLELSPDFLTFMNKGLERFADDNNVFQISGYMFDVPELKVSSSALFLPLTVSWGWGTWSSSWEKFDPLATGWEELKTNKVLRRQFNLDGICDYANMLIMQMQGMRDSWAVRWYWAVFKQKGLVLFPPTSLVYNSGFDGSGTNGRGFIRSFSKTRKKIDLSVIELPDKPNSDLNSITWVKSAVRRQNGGWLGPLVDGLRRFIKY